MISSFLHGCLVDSTHLFENLCDNNNQVVYLRLAPNCLSTDSTILSGLSAWSLNLFWPFFSVLGIQKYSFSSLHKPQRLPLLATAHFPVLWPLPDDRRWVTEQTHVSQLPGNLFYENSNLLTSSHHWRKCLRKLFSTLQVLVSSSQNYFWKFKFNRRSRTNDLLIYGV
jgi:hypothetical protein